jgi:hypothetical protein
MYVQKSFACSGTNCIPIVVRGNIIYYINNLNIRNYVILISIYLERWSAGAPERWSVEAL